MAQSKPQGKKAAKAAKPAVNHTPRKARLWLMYPPRLIGTPVIWQLAKKFEVTTNIRQASVTNEIGIVCLELEGERSAVSAAIKWLEHLGIKVEPVEISVLES
ncbi:MAG: NIL domain-containing protein [Verrucomicrobia bacterium]|nr:NIL domain-containing protein [Verrucomicrobiota bacterium]